MKKAMIDQVLLGGFLFIVIIVFAATVSDEKAGREKAHDLKKVTNTAALAVGNYYMFQTKFNDKETSEDISDSILDETKLGTEVKPNINYTWDDLAIPRTVTASISNYNQKNFWYTLLGLNSFTLQASSTAILDNGETNTFVPIAVNGCNNSFSEGSTFDYILKAADLYNPSDNVGFFGLRLPGNAGGGQSTYSHLKNIIDDVMKGKDSYYDFEQEPQSMPNVLSADIDNDVKQISSSFKISSFTPTPMSIVEVGCGSSSRNMVIERVFEITMNAVYCGNGCNNPLSGNCSLNNLNGGIFTDMNWSTAGNTCNNNQFFRINFTIDKIREKGVRLE